MSTYRYRYLDVKRKPLVNCPECGHVLTAENGISIECSSGFNSWDVPSHLDAHGYLHDPGGRVAKGDHSATRCGGCLDSLSYMDDVQEVPDKE